MKALFSIVVCLAMITFAGACFAQTELVNDTFDGGTDGVYLGANWTGCGFNSGAYNKLAYQNNQAGGSGFWAQDCALYTGNGVFPSDQYVTATIVSPTPSSSPQTSVQLRANAIPFTDESYIACGWDSQDFPPDYHYRMWSLSPGAPGPVSLYLSNITPAVNDVISCQILGNTLTMTLNGTKVATVIDTSGIVNGYPGLYYVDPNGSSPNPSDIIFDNFAAGSGPAVTSVVISPNIATVKAGSYLQFTGMVNYADGSTSNMNNWSSSDSSIATVDGSGFAYGANAGTAIITGASAADSGTANLSVLAAVGYSPLVNDSFVGNGGYLGSNWVGCGYDGGAYSELIYQNNQAGGSGYYSQNCSLYIGYGAFPSDQYGTAMVVAPIPTSTPEAAIQIRGNATPSTPESYIACGWDAQDFPADFHYRIWSLAPNGTPTSLFLSSVLPATNDLIWCQVLGNTVTMQVNGTTIATVADSSGLAVGYPGLYYIDLNGDAPPTTDVIFDNFVGGRVDGPVVASITIAPPSATVLIGSSVQFTATGTYTDGTVANISSSANWSSSDASMATVNASGLASGVNPGTVTITAAAGMATRTASLQVGGLSPTVTFTGAPANAPFNTTFSVTATTNASVMPTITGTTGVCSVSSVTGTPANASSTVTMLTGSGSCNLTANWAATPNYSAAGPLLQITAATKLTPVVTFTGAPKSATYNTSFTVNATTNASTMPQISGTANICRVGAVSGTPASSSASVTMINGTGTCTLSATWAADTNYAAPTAKTQSVTAAKATSTVTITANTPNPATLKQPVTISFAAAGIGAGPTGSVTVTGNANESCTSTLNPAHTGNCSISFSSAGSRNLKASYAGDNNFSSSTSTNVSQTVNSPTVSLNPTSVNYGSVNKGSSSTKAVTVSNTGTGALINLSWSISGSNKFTVASTTCGTTLNPAASCVINITFSPSGNGTQTGTLSLADNATNSPQAVSLTGSGK
jgi:hypothetical protein